MSNLKAHMHTRSHVKSVFFITFHGLGFTKMGTVSPFALLVSDIIDENMRRKIAGWTIMLTCVGVVLLTSAASYVNLPRWVSFPDPCFSCCQYHYVAVFLEKIIISWFARWNSPWPQFWLGE